MRFVQDQLQASVDPERSVKYLQTTYEKYLKGVVQDDNEAA